MNLFLIGYRGSGKTTVARLIALKLARPWVDADEEVEFRAGKSIAAIFADDGETAFRDLESRVIDDLAQRKDAVLALGGGAVTRPENRAAIRRSGKLIWLRATPETLWRRISADATTAERRPALTAYSGLAEITALLAERDPVYRQCADGQVDTENKSPAEVADEIIERWKPELAEPA